MTAAGKRLARAIRLAKREAAAGIAEARGGEDGGRLVIGAMPLCRALVLPHAIAALAAEAPEITVDVVEGSWRELVGPLGDGRLELMIGALRDPPPADLDQRPLFRDRLAVIGRAGHPLAAVAAPSLDQLADHGWIVGQGGTPLRVHWDALFAGRAAPAAPIECGSVMVSRGLLLRSDLLTLLSPDQVAMEMDAGLLAQIGPPLDQATRIIGVSTRRGWRPTEVQARFIALLDAASQATRVRQNE